MPEGVVNPYGTGFVARIRAWWGASSFLGDVALGFTVVTVGNSVMMLTGLDEPKTGRFAYVHLLGRLGIIALIVGLFHLGEIREPLVAWRIRARQAGHADHTRRCSRAVCEAALGFLLGSRLAGTARVFTVVVASVCLVVLVLPGSRPPAGGVGLYRNLVLLLVVLLPVMLAATRWWERWICTRRRAMPLRDRG